MASTEYIIEQFETGHRRLHNRWDLTRDVWDDRKRREFEEEHLFPLDQQCAHTLGGMQDVGNVITSAKKRYSLA